MGDEKPGPVTISHCEGALRPAQHTPVLSGDRNATGWAAVMAARDRSPCHSLCPLVAISGHSDGQVRESALPPKADITGGKLHRFLKADFLCLLYPRKRKSLNEQDTAATHPVASRSPDRTGVCCAGRSAPSQCKMATAPRFSSPNQPDQERITAYRDSSGPKLRSDAHFATIVGDWEKPYGESQFRRPGLISLGEATSDHTAGLIDRRHAQ